MNPPICDPSAASSEQSREEVRQRFLDACAAQREGPPPNAEVFVAAFPEPEALIAAQRARVASALPSSGDACRYHWRYQRK